MKILAALGSMCLFLLGKTSIFVQMQPDDTPNASIIDSKTKHVLWKHHVILLLHLYLKLFQSLSKYCLTVFQAHFTLFLSATLLFLLFLKKDDIWDWHATNQFYLLIYTVKSVSMPISSCTLVTANVGRVKLLWSTQKPKSFFFELWWVRCQSWYDGEVMRNIALNASHYK